MSTNFCYIWQYVRNNGKKIQRAQSAWGADRWEIDIDGEPVSVTLEDDGSTQGLFSRKVKCRLAYHDELVFTSGDELDLMELFLLLENR